jgi:hypothetical protein
MIKSLWNKTLKFGLLRLIGFCFIVVIPMIMLSELVSNSNAPLGVKISFTFCAILTVSFFVARNQLKKLALRVTNHIMREACFAALLVLWWTFGIIVIIAISAIVGMLEAFWWRVGVSFLIGSALYVAHAIKIQNNGSHDE